MLNYQYIITIHESGKQKTETFIASEEEYQAFLLSKQNDEWFDITIDNVLRSFNMPMLSSTGVQKVEVNQTAGAE